MRVRLSPDSRLELFSSLQRWGITRAKIAALCDVSSRTVLDWERGKYTIPLDCFSKLLRTQPLEQTYFTHEILEDSHFKKIAGKQGAASRMKLYGNPGTPESRAKGGQNSYIQRKNALDDIFAKKLVCLPARSKRLAEFIGIMIGDGTMTKYQFSIALSSIVDVEYCNYVTKLVEELFAVKPTVIKQRRSNCLVVLVSSVDLVNFLHSNGVVIGDKIRAGLDIPSWIRQDSSYAWACVRGICDTDGCIYQERHVINGKEYCYPRLSIVSASPLLRQSLYEILKDLQFNPKIRNNRSVQLEKTALICQYFKVIGTSNLKHARRWTQFGEVA